MKFANQLTIASAVLVIGSWWAWPTSQAPATAFRGLQFDTSAGLSLLSGGGSDTEPAQPAAAAPASPPQRNAQAVEQAIFVDGSLREADLDGHWGNWSGEELKPDIGLRQRFDQLLTTVGEATLPELRSLVDSLALRDTNEAQAAAVLELWDRYVALQMQRDLAALDLDNPAQWSHALQAHQLARRQHLGPAWADAFYQEDEQAARALIATRAEKQASPPLPSATEILLAAATDRPADLLHQQRIEAFGAQAALRLQAEDQAQAAWSSRLTQAQATLAGLNTAPELSAPQKAQAIEQWMQRAFSATEQVRARALLGLPPNGQQPVN